MESTAQHWKPVQGGTGTVLETNLAKRDDAGPMSGTLHLAQAQSNRGRWGFKKDFPDACPKRASKSASPPAWRFTERKTSHNFQEAFAPVEFGT